MTSFPHQTLSPPVLLHYGKMQAAMLLSPGRSSLVSTTQIFLYMYNTAVKSAPSSLNTIALSEKQVLSVTEKEEVPARAIFWVIFTSGTWRIRKVQCLNIYEQNRSTLFPCSNRKCSSQKGLGCQLSSTTGAGNPKDKRKAMAGSQGQISSGHPKSCGIREFGRTAVRHHVTQVPASGIDGFPAVTVYAVDAAHVVWHRGHVVQVGCGVNLSA